jgi:hypothetical protein
MQSDTIALEFVPPLLAAGAAKAREETHRLVELAARAGLGERLSHLMIPGMIDEDPDRPVPLEPRMDPLEVWRAIRDIAPVRAGFCTQVTPFLRPERLADRVDALVAAGIEGIIFVGVPRGMQDGEGGGLSPAEALTTFSRTIDRRGVILIPTRAGEKDRFAFKCDRGASFGLTQLLFSDAIVDLLGTFARSADHRPEILLSFGYVPALEGRVGLIEWLIQDPGNPRVPMEQAFVARLAELSFAEKKRELLDLYRRCVDGLQDLGFPLGLHLETPYGFSEPAFEFFAELLEDWERRRA